MALSRAARLAVGLLAAAAAIGCDDTMTGPTATPTPSAATPTPAAPHVVLIGQSPGGGRGNVFVDTVSGGSTTTIHAGDTVQWNWLSGTHSTTSGVCALGCVANGFWDSGVASSGTFQHTFSTTGTFPYFCQVHGNMMQGVVVVQ